jgi:hypothetical protein
VRGAVEYRVGWPVRLLAAQSVRVLMMATLPAGLWGGDHVRMVVTDAGARLEYDCAASTIDKPITADARGNFTATGIYTAERGGVRRDGRPVAVRARYTGHVTGDTMKLKVTLENSRKPIGVFTLKRGEDTLLAKCR